jgi:voltage-gated potassium channel
LERGLPDDAARAWNGASSPLPGYISPAVTRWRAGTDVPLLALAIGSLPLLLLELKRSSLPHSDRVFLDALNIVVLLAFAIDYVVELTLTRDRRRYVRREWTSLLIVVAQAAAVLPGLAAVGALRFLRGARAFRAGASLLRLFVIGGAAAKEGRSLIRKRAASLALSVAGMTWLASAVAFTMAEGVGEDSRIHSFFDALWWSVTTMATVGYGDIYPVTGVGRLVAGVTMLVGIATFAVVTAKVAEFLVRAEAVGSTNETVGAPDSD